MKLIDKDALVAEIERMQDAYIAKLESRGMGHEESVMASISYVNGIKDAINSLEVKEVDLDSFMKEEFDKYSGVDGYGQLSVSYNEAEFYSMIKRLIKAQKGENKV